MVQSKCPRMLLLRQPLFLPGGWDQVLSTAGYHCQNLTPVFGSWRPRFYPSDPQAQGLESSLQSEGPRLSLPGPPSASASPTTPLGPSPLTSYLYEQSCCREEQFSQLLHLVFLLFSSFYCWSSRRHGPLILSTPVCRLLFTSTSFLYACWVFKPQLHVPSHFSCVRLCATL